ncbi:MAG: chorismate mutase [Rikenellaceae bacterium]|jgi:chorismate mutase|nr:chorismate mutase [Rikenellaceae bacterium]
MKSFDLHAKRPLLIAGPCSAETEQQTVETMVALAKTGLVDVLRAGIWKPRTNPGSFEGIGVKGLPWLARAKELTGLPLAVEVATAKHVEQALDFGVDILWVGARTTVNPFSVQEIANAAKGSGAKILVKNPVSPDIDLWAGAINRFVKMGFDERDLGLIHRGFSSFGRGEYRNAPMWHLAIEMRSRFPQIAIICDPSHITGKRELLYEVAQKAADLYYDGLMVESHIDPSCALSDAAQQLTPADYQTLAQRILWRRKSADNPEYINALERLRGQIDEIDSELFALMGRRMKIAEHIGEVKRDNNVAILQSDRWNSIVDKVVSGYSGLGLSDEFLRRVLDAIHTESINHQNRVMNK